jgi:hypothetical protein
MSSAPTASTAADLPREPSPIGAILSYLIPGLGQICQGRFGKGLLFMVSLLGMFFLGQAMGSWQNVYLPLPENHRGGNKNVVVSLMNRWHYAGQFWIGVAAWPALYQYFRDPIPADQANSFWHNFQRMPSETAVNEFLVNSDKIPDLGWVYTVIAGMLNILVIYDAYAGPAIPSAPRPSRSDPLAANVPQQTQGGTH